MFKAGQIVFIQGQWKAEVKSYFNNRVLVLPLEGEYKPDTVYHFDPVLIEPMRRKHEEI